MLAKLSKQSHKWLFFFLTLGFVFKAAGASWDAAFHFKYFREFYQLPHILNAIGGAIVLVTLFYLWRHETAVAKRSLRVIILGIFLFILSIGLDQWWHETFGLDLTAWSPAHFALYLSTTVSLIGGLFYIAHNYKHGGISVATKNIYSLIFFTMILEAFWFPLLQFEQGVMTNYYLSQGVHTMSQELFDVYFSANRDVYGGLPGWLYGAWAVFGLATVFYLVKRLNFYRYSATAVAGFYVAFRFVANLAYVLVAYPTSTVPFYILPIAFLVDLVFMFFKPASWWAGLVSFIVIVFGFNAIGFIQTTRIWHPPMADGTLWFSIIAGLAGYLLAWLSYRYLFKERV